MRGTSTHRDKGTYRAARPPIAGKKEHELGLEEERQTERDRQRGRDNERQREKTKIKGYLLAVAHQRLLPSSSERSQRGRCDPVRKEIERSHRHWAHEEELRRIQDGSDELKIR